MLTASHLHEAKLMASVSAAFASMHFCRGNNQNNGNRHGTTAQPCCRRTVHDIYLCLDAKYLQRAYHMMYQSFCNPHQEVKEGIDRAPKYMLEKMQKQRRAWHLRKRKAHHVGGRCSNQPRYPPIPNGKISSEVRLTCALRYFSGGITI
jgi:hypothetical protein